MPSSTQPRLSSPRGNGFHRLRFYLQIIAAFRRRRKIALLIGINYINGGKLELKGSQKDIEALEKLLKDDLGFDKVIVLWDREGTPESMVPTKANILRELETLISSHPGADFFFAYSGHTYQRLDCVGDDEDGEEDYCIVPCDALDLSRTLDEPGEAFLESFVISGKTLHRFLVQCLPRGSQLVALFESCHSGSLLDLRHRNCNRVGGYRSIIQDGFRLVSEPLIRQLNRIGMLCRRKRHYKLNRPKTESTESLVSAQENPSRNKRKGRCIGFCSRVSGYERQVICFSSCDDSQLTVDSHDGGAMIQSFVQFLRTNRRPTYKEVMKAITEGVRVELQDRRRMMDNYLAAKNTCDITCSAFRHRWCLDSNERLILAKCDPQLSSLRPINTNGILRL